MPKDIHTAIMLVRTGEIEEILHNDPDTVNHRNKIQNTPLHTLACACPSKKNEEIYKGIVSLLLKYKPNPLLKNQYQETALELAERLNSYPYYTAILRDYTEQYKSQHQHDEKALGEKDSNTLPSSAVKKVDVPGLRRRLPNQHHHSDDESSSHKNDNNNNNKDNMNNTMQLTTSIVTMALFN